MRSQTGSVHQQDETSEGCRALHAADDRIPFCLRWADPRSTRNGLTDTRVGSVSPPPIPSIRPQERCHVRELSSFFDCRSEHPSRRRDAPRCLSIHPVRGRRYRHCQRDLRSIHEIFRNTSPVAYNYDVQSGVNVLIKLAVHVSGGDVWTVFSAMTILAAFALVYFSVRAVTVLSGKDPISPRWHRSCCSPRRS